MILTINTRSGRELVSGGVDVSEQVLDTATCRISGVVCQSPYAAAPISNTALLQASVEDLKAAISKANTKYYPSRQRLTLLPEPGQRSGNPLLDGKLLTEYNLTNGSTVVFKDLGTQASHPWCIDYALHVAVTWLSMQVGWTTVFFWEYFGPLAVYPLFYFLPQFLYPGIK